MSKKTKLGNNLYNTQTTGTGLNTAMVGLQSNDFLEPDSNLMSKRDKVSEEKKVEEPNPLEKLTAKTKELKLKLKKLNKQLTEEKNNFMNQASELNLQIKEREGEITELSSQNKYLMKKLKKLKSTLDDKMKLGKEYADNMKKRQKAEEVLKKNKEIQQKEIDIAKKHQKIILNDIDKIKKKAEKNDADKEENLKKKLESLEKQKEELINENISLKKLIKEHKICSKIKSNLLSQVNVLKNEYQFEIKASNWAKSHQEKIDEKKVQIKESKLKKVNNRSISYGNRVRNEVFLKQEQKKSHKILVPKKVLSHVEGIFSYIDEESKKKSGSLENRHNENYQNKPKILFTESEELQLNNIIPNQYITEIKKRFDTVENQRYKIMDKMKNNNKENESYLNDLKLKIIKNNMIKKGQEKSLTNLHHQLTQKVGDLNNLQKEVIKINKEIKYWDKILNAKNFENERMKKYLQMLKNKSNENSAKKAQSYVFERDNNINIAYNMK